MKIYYFQGLLAELEALPPEVRERLECFVAKRSAELMNGQFFASSEKQHTDDVLFREVIEPEFSYGDKVKMRLDGWNARSADRKGTYVCYAAGKHWIECECGNSSIQQETPEAAAFYWNERNNLDEMIYSGDPNV